MHDTEDKQWWVNKYRSNEDLFVNEVCPKLGLIGQINPEKEKDPFTADLVVNGKLADLKCQETPFFKAGVLYGIDPQYAVTFNEKDRIRYTKKYPDIIVYFWVNWKKLSMVINGITYSVQPMEGIWEASIRDITSLLQDNEQHLHSYQNRVSDTAGNAKASYVLDLRQLICLNII